MFAVRTPIATVTDLGTEFGVEVRQSGATSASVFQGVVEVRPIEADGQLSQVVRLTENQSAYVEKSEDSERLTVRRGDADPAAFVRVGQLPKFAEELRLKPLRRWQAYSQKLRSDPDLVAYYTFEAANSTNTSVLPNASAAGKALDGQIDGAEWVAGRLPGKFALYFHGSPSDKVVLPEQERFKFTGEFSVAAWFKIGWLKKPHCQVLVAKADTSWLLEQDQRTDNIVFDTRYEVSPGVPPPKCHLTRGKSDIADDRWHLAVGVYEPVGSVASKRLYIDDHLDAENSTEGPLYQNDNPVWLGGNSAVAGRVFCGFIDEVAIFGRALSDDEVAAMFEAGRPTDSRVEQRPFDAREKKQGR